MSESSTNSFLPDTPMNENSLSPGSRRRMMYDVPLVPVGFAAFQRSVRFQVDRQFRRVRPSTSLDAPI